MRRDRKKIYIHGKERRISNFPQKHKSKWFHSDFFFKLWRNIQFQCYLHAPRKLREGGPVLFISLQPFLWSPVFPVFHGSWGRALLVGLWLVLPAAGASARLGRKRDGEAKAHFRQSWLVRAGAGRLTRDSDGGGGECLDPEWPHQMSGYASFWGFNCLM